MAEVRSHQAGRACRVGADTRPPQPKAVGDAADQERQRVAGGRGGCGFVEPCCAQHVQILGRPHRADVDAGGDLQRAGAVQHLLQGTVSSNHFAHGLPRTLLCVTQYPGSKQNTFGSL